LKRPISVGFFCYNTLFFTVDLAFCCCPHSISWLS